MLCVLMTLRLHGYSYSRCCRSEVAPKQWTRAVTFEASLMKHLKSRKHHSKAFRKDAVELLLTGRTLHELAGELGVSKTVKFLAIFDYYPITHHASRITHHV